ncbi:Uncharacterised protein [Amycolatopsis camponoti]|uniref:Uncharacterized protein n=1 Tax=Amycolatopsis camponoti TaxID=2606593 RepID=A0A6I8LP10_9PSEU|nr:Uncharacterised protein [Amycolatopsis camponoti]
MAPLGAGHGWILRVSGWREGATLAGRAQARAHQVVRRRGRNDSRTGHRPDIDGCAATCPWPCRQPAGYRSVMEATPGFDTGQEGIYAHYEPSGRGSVCVVAGDREKAPGIDEEWGTRKTRARRTAPGSRWAAARVPLRRTRGCGHPGPLTGALSSFRRCGEKL